MDRKKGHVYIRSGATILVALACWTLWKGLTVGVVYFIGSFLYMVLAVAVLKKSRPGRTASFVVLLLHAATTIFTLIFLLGMESINSLAHPQQERGNEFVFTLDIDVPSLVTQESLILLAIMTCLYLLANRDTSAVFRVAED